MGRARTHPNYEKHHAWYEANRGEILRKAKIRRLELVTGQETLRDRNRRLKQEAAAARVEVARRKDSERYYEQLRQHVDYQELLQVIREYKEQNPCVDCGNRFPFYVMDFDHVIGEKIADVSRLMYRLARKRISMIAVIEEIEKCDLVCSNCHRTRTYARQHPRAA